MTTVAGLRTVIQQSDDARDVPYEHEHLERFDGAATIGHFEGEVEESVLFGWIVDRISEGS